MRINIPNPYGVYMHDTPEKGMFGDDFRFVSSGCVRVQDVRDYVAWLLKDTPGWSRDQIDAVIRSGDRADVKLAQPVKVYWVYITAWATPDGLVQFRPDIYQRDGVGSGPGGLGRPGPAAGAAAGISLGIEVACWLALPLDNTAGMKDSYSPDQRRLKRVRSMPRRSWAQSRAALATAPNGWRERSSCPRTGANSGIPPSQSRSPLLPCWRARWAPTDRLAPPACARWSRASKVPSEKILQCGATLTVRPAPGARYQPLYKKNDPMPVGIRLTDGALLIEFHPAKPEEKFQILTPLAIAAVRGTKWAMDVTKAQTSTLVLNGAVAVTNRRLNKFVVLTEGQGVDITAADTTIVQKTWGDARKRALLARFGE